MSPPQVSRIVFEFGKIEVFDFWRVSAIAIFEEDHSFKPISIFLNLDFTPEYTIGFF